MNILRARLASLRANLSLFDLTIDRWVAKNVVPFWTQARFNHAQRMHRPSFARFRTISTPSPTQSNSS